MWARSVRVGMSEKKILKMSKIYDNSFTISDFQCMFSYPSMLMMRSVIVLKLTWMNEWKVAAGRSWVVVLRWGVEGGCSTDWRQRLGRPTVVRLRYQHTVWCVCVHVDVLSEDSANYTCQIDGPLNTVIGTVTHSVIVSGLSVCLSVSTDTL